MHPLTKFNSINVLCIGDVMLDRFIGGDVNRISPEGPVPVFFLRHTSEIPGGAANVARNITSLNGRCTLLGLIGEDVSGAEVIAALAKDARISNCLIRSKARPTTEKLRYISQGQHILRADRECTDILSVELENDLLLAAGNLLPGHNVVILSDYAKGVLTDRLIEYVIVSAKKLHIPVIVDPKSARLERYAGATIVTPNSKELQMDAGIDPSVANEQAGSACRSVLERTAIENILVTKAEKGMTLLVRGTAPIHIAASAREVADVVGAGDTVVATLALAMGAGASLEEAARLSNMAAGIAVGKHGTATVTNTELLDQISKLDQFEEGSIEENILSWDDARQRAALSRKDGPRVGFTNGCFDLLHVGHLKLLKYARGNCDRLIVGLNTDTSVRRLKGQNRPINSEMDRASLIAALNMVDCVVLFDQETPRLLIQSLQPDVLVKGADYSIDEIVGADLVFASGGTVLRCELLPNRSTTHLIE